MVTTMEDMKLTIRPATEGDVNQIVDILTDAFETDPAFRRIMQPLSDETKNLRKIFDLQLRHEYLPYGIVDVEFNEEGEMLGVALWNKPGKPITFLSLLRYVPDYVRVFGKSFIGAVLRERKSEKLHPQFPHWYLYTLAVRPGHQGEGLGTTLLRHGMERAGETPIYLEASTPDSAALYKRLGFVPLGEIPDDDDMPSELGMWHPGTMPERPNHNN